MIIHSTYKRILEYGRHRHAEKTLAGVSFIGSSIFPLPPDMFLAPMVLAEPRKWWRLAAICTLASVMGAIAGYIMGAAAYEWLAKPIMEFYGAEENFHKLHNWYQSYGGWALMFASVTPFPYKVITIFSGVVHFNIFAFILISLIGRSIRFFLVAFLLQKFGKDVETFIQKKLGIVLLIICLTILIFYLIIKAIF